MVATHELMMMTVVWRGVADGDLTMTVCQGGGVGRKTWRRWRRWRL